jgi:isopenicillin N synthase-like dioxygenase
MKVAICDLQSADFEQTLLKSLVNTGFAVLTHHGIDFELIKDAQQEWRKFFKRERLYKNLFVNGNDSNMGYKGMGTETAVGAKVADLKEFFHYKLGEEIPENAEGPTEKLFVQLESLGMQILDVLDKTNGTTYRNDCYNSTKTLFRALYYPPLSADGSNVASDIKEGAVRAAAHEDINHITMLVAASAPGLQVQDNKGNWYDVPHEENSVVVNIGDMLKLASNGLYRSTTHRVINPTDIKSDRVSMPLFIHPHSHVRLAHGITAGQFLNERITQIYGKK